MKKTILLDKSLEFSSMIGELITVSLDQDLHFINESNIEGNLYINGKYKLTEASQLEENFNFKIPVEITLTERLDLDTATVHLDNFRYELTKEDILNINAELKIEGLEIIDEIPKEEATGEEQLKSIEKIPSLRDCDGDYAETKEESIEIPTKEKIKSEEEKPQKEIIKDQEGTNIKSIFSSFKETEETFSSYSVYIIRQEETLQSILDKYKTTKEEFEKYNNINDLKVGSKIIIPNINE